MYKIASEKAQRGRERIRPAELIGYGLPEAQSIPDRLRNLSAAIHRVEIEIREAKAQNKPPVVLKALGLRKLDIQSQIQTLKTHQSRRGVRSLSQHFIEVAAERLPRELFEELKTEAHSRHLKDFGNAG